MKVCFVDKRFQPATLGIIEQADAILQEFADDGLEMTLRGLYYQFIGQDLFPDSWVDDAYNARKGLPPGTKNTDKNYARLKSIVTDARLAGLLDWDHIIDRTRPLHEWEMQESPEKAIQKLAETYAIDLWADQKYRPEIWIEKDTLLGWAEKACVPLGVPYTACRGSPSQSMTWVAAQRFRWQMEDEGKVPIVFYLGDHDPTGLDITRDLRARFDMLLGLGELVLRVALTREQVRANRLPPNPAKTTDSRAAGYIREFGNESWEVDALGPRRLIEMITAAVESIRDDKAWRRSVKRLNEERHFMQRVAKDWKQITGRFQKKKRRKGRPRKGE